MSGTLPVDEKVPATIGRYQITGSLGYGAMGAVYKAFDPLIKRPLAIKTVRLDIPRGSPQYRSFLERFQHEAQISGTLSHPGIVTLFDLGEEEGVPFFAMEFVDGQTVADVLALGERFKPERVIALVSQVAAALDYAHSRGVVHRDIKPANLILYADDKVKVTDFGIAKLADSDITHAGALLGTPSYMSPEQAMGEKLDGRSDIFSLGVVAFEMLSGQQPFPGPNVTSILYKLVHVPPVEPGDLEMLGLVPQKWREVFSKVLAKRPEGRYQTASAFVQDLEYCLGSWWTGLGNEETLTIAATPEVATVEIPRLPGAPPPPAAQAAAQPVEDGDVETVLIPPKDRAPRPAEADIAAATLVMPATPSAPDETPATVILSAGAAVAAGGAETHPPEPTVLIPALRTPAAAAPPRLPGAAAAAVPPPLPVTATLARPAAVEPPPTAPMPARQAHAPTAPPYVAPPAADAPASVPPASLPPPSAAAPSVPPRPGASRPGLPLPVVILGGAAAGLVVVGLGAWLFRPAAPSAQPSPSAAPPVTAAAQPTPVPSPPVTPAVATDATPAPRPTPTPRRAPASGAADFVSNPPGATVTVDGKAVGTTPLHALKLAAGKRRVEIALDGHEPWETTLDVAAGTTGTVDVRLRALPKPTPTPEPVDTARVYPNEAGQVDALARRLSGGSPSYPSGRAPRLRSGQRVSVLLRFVVDEKGEVQDVTVVESAGKVVDDVVVAAVKGWKYEPATKGGVRVKVETSFRQTFLGA